MDGRVVVEKDMAVATASGTCTWLSLLCCLLCCRGPGAEAVLTACCLVCLVPDGFEGPTHWWAGEQHHGCRDPWASAATGRPSQALLAAHHGCHLVKRPVSCDIHGPALVVTACKACRMIKRPFSFLFKRPNSAKFCHKSSVPASVSGT